MKRIKAILISIIGLLFLIPSVQAASGSVTVASPSQVVSGNKLTVTVTISSGTAIGSWQMNLNYDKSYLQLLSATSEAGGTMMANSSATGVTKKSYTFTFKTLKTGNTSLSITSALAYAFSDLSQISLSMGKKTVKIITQAELEASYSKDNNLKSLAIEGVELNPKFSKEVLEYSAIVPEDTKTIKITATPSDSRSSVSGVGEKEVSLGSNSFDIVVKAENGSEKVYKLKVEVKDSNPIVVKVDNKELTLVKVKDFLEPPTDFTETTIKISDVDIPGFKNENINLTLVGLKDADGNINLYSYDEKTSTYTKFNSVKTNSISIMPLETKDELKGYKKVKVAIDSQDINGYKTNESSRFAVIYGIDISTGEKGYFMYDSKLNTLIAYNTELIDQLQSQNQLFMYIIIGFIGILLVLFIALLSVSKKKKKLIKEIENAKKPKRKKDEMIEL